MIPNYHKIKHLTIPYLSTSVDNLIKTPPKTPSYALKIHPQITTNYPMNFV